MTGVPDRARPLLEVFGLTKSFGGAQALDGVTFEIAAGEVHGLLGANGSGKSTLIKILAGYHDVDAGELTVGGHDVPLPVPAGAPQELGLSFVHQDLGLVASLSALENFYLDEIATSRRSLRMSWRRKRTAMLEVLDRYGLDMDPRTLVSDLRPVDRALLAIVRAIDGPGRAVRARQRLVVLDEPTVFLPRDEVQRLFELVRRVAAAGSSVLFVSHDLDEVREITDRVTVLRNGQVVLTGRTAELAAETLVEAIVGAQLSKFSAHRHGTGSNGGAAVEVSDLEVRQVRGLSLGAHRGEVIGLTGLLGSGYEDVLRAIAGAVPAQHGRLRLQDSIIDLSSWSPRQAHARGVVLVPGDRLAEGAIADLPVTDNVTMPRLSEFVRAGVLSRRAMTASAAELAEAYDVRPRDPRLRLGQLSGGNQQKVVMAKWLQTRPRLLLLHEPTQGVDVGARQQIFTTIRAAARDGVVLCASSDHEQLAQLCDRVLVLRRGNIAAELSGPQLTKERLTEECLRGGRERTAS